MDDGTVDCGLRTEDCRFSDCGLMIEIADWRLAIAIADCAPGVQSTVVNRSRQSSIQIDNRQSQNPQSPIRNPQSI